MRTSSIPLPIPASLARSVALAAAVVLAPVVAEAQQGVTFTYQMHGTNAPPRQGASSGSAGTVMTATVRAAGPNMRIDWREGAPGVPMMKPGAYMLLRGADRSLLIVNPEDKAAIKIDAQSFGSGAGTMTNNAFVKVSQKEAKFDFEELGAGDRILGYPTRHVRVSSSGTTDVRVMGKTTSSTTQSTGEAWIATGIKGVDAEALRQWSQSFGRGLRQTNADLVPRLADYDRKYGDGLALRTVMVSTSSDDKGRARTDTIRMEVTDLTASKLDPSLFEVPAGYQVADTRQMGAALDSARKANGLDSVSAGDVMKAGTKDAVKGALGGFLRRKKP
ncbi:MAG: DUF4412 domain-containing protein [Gemmatirosa sp.]|nr:DUF4412 domain-containing protein [Gemmatirosa sp.]